MHTCTHSHIHTHTHTHTHTYTHIHTIKLDIQLNILHLQRHLSAVDRLRAANAIPAGFHVSTLADLRHVRVVLSNVLVLQASCSPAHPKLWSFHRDGLPSITAGTTVSQGPPGMATAGDAARVTRGGWTRRPHLGRSRSAQRLLKACISLPSWVRLAQLRYLKQKQTCKRRQLRNRKRSRSPEARLVHAQAQAMGRRLCRLSIRRLRV
jgi:hypothetical protein